MTDTTRWAILRTSGARTLPLVRSLNGDGIAAWSPKQVIERRRGLSRARFSIDVPILPTFVFVGAGHCDDLRRILREPVNPHPGFRIFTYRDAIPLVFESELAKLRSVEEDARTAIRKRERFHFEQGDNVRVEDGSFLGLAGVVESCDGRNAWVKFGGTMRVKIGAWKLLTEQVKAA